MSIKSLKNQTFTNKSYFNSINLSGGGTAAPVITSIIICDSNFNNLDDTALAPGGSFVKLIGTGFKTGCTVYFNNQSLSATFISSSEVRIQTPATTVGSYNIMLFNPGSDGGAIYLNLSVSNAPTWTTNAGSLGTQYETTAVNTSVSATGDTPIVYSLFSGNLPAGTTLSSDGTLSGTAPAETSSTTYSFTVNAKDAQNQDTTRTFSLTINVDVVSWTTPTSNQVISSYEYSPISNVTLLASSAAGYSANNYSANALPTGITLAGNTISGTANSVGNTFTRLTATSNTSGRSATRDIVFNVNQDVVTWNSPADGTQYALPGGSAISNVTLSASSAAGFGVQYTANALPSGLTLSGSTISGTPTTAQTVTTLLTATASTTNRSATRTISWTISLGDLNWRNTTFALNATQPTTPYITDSSNNNTQLSIFGDTRPSNFNPYQQGYYSNYFNGSSTGLTIPGTNGAFAFGTGNFTIEFWAYSTAFSGILCSIASSWSLRMESSGAITWYIGGANGGTTTSTVSLNTWNHFAVVRTGTGTNQFVIYVNGQPGYTNTRSDNITSTNTLYIGVLDTGNSGYYPGYISNFRVIKGTALYTGAFTPSTTPLRAVANTSLLTCQDNTFIDESPNNLTITRTGVPIVSSAHPFATPTTVAYNTQYSTFFNGSSYAYLNNQVALGSGNFTIEFWANFRDVSNGQNLYEGRPNGANGAYPTIYILSGTIRYYVSSTDRITSGTILTNNWYHIAVVRNSGTTTMYINGVSAGTYSDSTTYLTGDSRPLIASYNGSGGNFTGTISNLRVVTGTAVYTSNFTPSTTPLTAIANTTLLTCQSTTVIDNSTNNFAFTTVGTQPIAVSPFTMTTANTTITSLGSAYFDGTGDYITPPPTSAVAMGSGDFTIDFWVYPHSVGNSGIFQIFTSAFPSSISGSLCLAYNSGGGGLNFTFNGTSGFVGVAQQTYTWTHFAIAKSGGTIRLYQNGIQISSQSDTATYSGTYLVLGGYWSTSYLHTGYISDFRIVKGNALYTRNFLPPQVPSTPVANTQLLTVQTNGGATNNGFVDQSSFNNIITRSGNATQGTFSPYSQTGWSNYFDGSGDYLTLPTNAAFAIGTADFTVEMWVMPTATNLPWTTLFAGVNYGASSDWGLYGGDSATSLYPMFFFTSSSSQGNGTNQTQGSQSLTGYTRMTIGQWNHIAVSRVSGTARMFLNGTQTGPSVNASTWSLTNSLQKGIGGGFNGNSNTLFTGYISNLRVVSGTGLYSANFTPSTTPLSVVPGTILLTCQDNRIIDESRNIFTVTRVGDVSTQAFSPFGGVTSVPTSYSVYFDGTGDYLTVPDNTALQMGSGDFTIEFWINYSSIAGYPTPFSKGYTAAGDILLQNGNGTGALIVYLSGVAAITESTGATVGQWYHYALVRSGTTVTLYRDGVSRGTATSSVNFNTTNQLGIGATGKAPGGGAVGDFAVNGYMSNVRIVKGTAVYTGAFTPSTAPLTAVANTQLLTCQSSTIVDNSSNYFTVTATGDTRPLAFNPFGQTNTTSVSYSPSVNGGSMYFDGTGDKLTVANYPTLGFKANDFTIQCWFYTNVASTEQVIMTNGWSSYAPWLIRIDTANTLRLNMSLTGGSWHVNEQSLGTVTPGQWYHVAVTRTSGVLRAFTNGVQTYTVDLSTSALYDASQALTIGGRSDTVVPFNGYLSDAQIINGFSLYRANFVPPVAPATPTYTIGTTRGSSTLLLSGTSGGIIDMHGTNNLETLADVKIAPENPFESGFYSNFFDGTGDYLSIPTNTGLDFSSGDFTIEAWVYPNSLSSDWFIASASGSGGFFFGYNSVTGGFGWGRNAVQWDYQPTTTKTAGAWQHVAVTRSGTSMRLFVNGTQQGTTQTISTAYNMGTTSTTIGSQGANFYLNGFISNLRVVKGTALYTSNFTPSTTSLTAVTNTQLLTCQSNSFIDNSTNNLTITRNGDVAVRSFNPFKRNTGQSYFFDGTGDYLSSPASPQFAFGTGDYTIEAWVYRTDSGVQRAIVDLRGGNNVNILFFMNSSNQLVAFNSTSTWITSSSTIPLNQWTHVAITRSGTSARLFINGVIVGTATNSDNNVSPGAAFVGRQNGSTTNDWLGYIDDVRITRGVARYTANNQVNLTSTFEVK